MGESQSEWLARAPLVPLTRDRNYWLIATNSRANTQSLVDDFLQGYFESATPAEDMTMDTDLQLVSAPFRQSGDARFAVLKSWEGSPPSASELASLTSSTKADPILGKRPADLLPKGGITPTTRFILVDFSQDSDRQSVPWPSYSPSDWVNAWSPNGEVVLWAPLDGRRLNYGAEMRSIPEHIEQGSAYAANAISDALTPDPNATFSPLTKTLIAAGAVVLGLVVVNKLVK